jgi:hypothetical protein
MYQKGDSPSDGDMYYKLFNSDGITMETKSYLNIAYRNPDRNHFFVKGHKNFVIFAVANSGEIILIK